MDFPSDFFGDSLPPFNILMDDTAQTYWLTYIGAIIVSAGVYAYKRRHKSLRLRAMLRYALATRYFKHPSSFLDLKLFLAASLTIFLQGGLILALSHFLTEEILSHFPARDPADYWPSTMTAKLVIPVALFLIFELGYWYAHYLLHKVPWLWEFHKVHHSAEIMTPVSELRQHPVELFLTPFVTGIALAPFYAMIFWVYGKDMEVYSFWEMGTFVFVFYLTFGHLRHSHINIGTSGIWSYLVQSPLHHQIHHSIDPKHYDTNLGFCLSVWDWAFGTLSKPEKGQKIEYGIYDDLKTNYSFWTHLLEPFRQSYLVITGRKKPFSRTVFSQKTYKM